MRPTGQGPETQHPLGMLSEVRAVGSLSDEALLRLFAEAHREAAEAAFATLVERHGPMVLQVCRRVLGPSPEIHDAFQATFLVLARRASSLRVGDSLGPWCHAVAYRVAAKARVTAARRRSHEAKGATPAAAASVLSSDPLDEVGAALHEEVERLPTRYRDPIVLCYLEGLTHEATANALGWPVGTVRGRLARARDLLRGRLERRGFAPSGGWGWVATLDAASAAPAALPASVARSVSWIAAERAVGMAPPAVATLASGWSRGAWLMKWQVAVVVLAAVGGGVGLLRGVAAPVARGPEPVLPVATVVPPPLAGPQGADDEPLRPGGNFDLTVVGPGGKPVAGAPVEFRAEPRPEPGRLQRGSIDRRQAYGTVVRADDAGRITVQYPEVPTQMILQIQTPGFGPYWAAWDRTNNSAAIPARFTAELDAAWTVGGVVVDPKGQPVAGASVRPWIESKKRPGDNTQMGVGAIRTTDAQGRWRYECVPVDLSEVHVTIDQAGFRPFDEPLARDQYTVKPGQDPAARIALDRGLTVAGTVRDDRGQPIAGATIRTKFHNEIRRATSGPDGVYRLSGCDAKATRLVVSAPGRAFTLRQVTVSPDLGPVDFTLPPGGTIRIRVLRPDGQPEPGARIFFQGWGDQRVEYFEFDEIKQQADADGIWTWNEAPVEPVAADICPKVSDAMQLVSQPLRARDAEYVFRLPPTLVISGRVVDAETKQPISRFRVVEGGRWANSDRLHWNDRQSFVGSDGQFTVRNTRLDGAFLVRVEAEGYEAALSREVRADEGKVAVDFALKRGRSIGLELLTPDGQPASGARVALGIAGAQIQIANGEFNANSTFADIRTTDSAGRVTFAGRDKPFRLIALHPTGSARLEITDAGEAPRQVRLDPWASVTGTFRVGPNPGANVRLALFTAGIDTYGPDLPNISAQHLTTTDAAGHYRFDRVFAGRATIRRDNTILLGTGSATQSSSIPSHVEVASGQTTTFNLGGTGRAVVGRFAMAPGVAEPSDWSFAGIMGRSATPGPGGAEVIWFTATVVRDATFRIDDLPPGNYSLRVGTQRSRGSMLANYPFAVPPADPANPHAPVDLGTILVPKSDPEP